MSQMISNNEEEFKYKSSEHASGQKDFILYHLIKGFTLKEILFALPDKLSQLLQCFNKFQNIQPNNTIIFKRMTCCSTLTVFRTKEIIWKPNDVEIYMLYEAWISRTLRIRD